MLELKLSERDMLLMMRRQKGINQDEVARFIGAHQPLISDFERCKCELTRIRYEKYKEFIINYEHYQKQDEAVTV